MKKKAMIFIDGSNVFYDWKNSAGPGRNMDVHRFLDCVKNKFSDIDVIRTYYFISESEQNKNFLQSINKIPYFEVITGRLQQKPITITERYGLVCPECGKEVTGQVMTMTDKGTDVNIAVEMIRHAYEHSYEKAILISRDAHFSGVVKIIKSLGMNVELVLFEGAQTKAQELSAEVDNVVVLHSDDYAECEMLYSGEY